jgi:hypothetical protein
MYSNGDQIEEDKQQEKARRQQEKLEEKQRRDEEKAAKVEQKKLAKEEKKKPRPQAIVTDPQTQESRPEAQESRPEAQESLHEIQDVHGEDPEIRHEFQDVHHEDNEVQEQEQVAETQNRREDVTPERTITPTQDTAAVATAVAPPPPTATAAVAAPTTAVTDNAETSQRKSSSEAPTSPTARVKGWIKNRFSRGKSMSEHGEKKKSFIGGAALRDSAAGGSTASLGNRSSSIRDVTLAGRTGDETPVNHTAEVAREATPDIALEPAPEIVPETAPEPAHETAHETTGRDSRGVSPVSTRSGIASSGNGSGRSNHVERFETPAAIKDPAPRHSNSPARDSRFREMMDH